jgi:group I intron endonuclease
MSNKKIKFLPFILNGNPMIGVYKIKNIINNKCYYGSSKEIEKRWSRHKNDLNKNKHHNIFLQRAWNKYGETNFLFEIVETCEIEQLLVTEQKYLDNKPDYNIGLIASGGDNITNNPNKDVIIEKITKSINAQYDLMTDEEKKEKYSQPMDKNPNWRGGASYIYCECGKRIGYGHKKCIKCLDKKGCNNPFFGKFHTDEYKNNASKRQEGVYNGKQNIPIIIDGVSYRSAGEASKKLSIPMVTIRWRVKSNNKKFESYQYKI